MFSPALAVPGGIGGYCPVCDRYIGPVEECPYCEIDPPWRGRLDALKAGSIVVAIAGTALLLALARSEKTRAVHVSELGPEYQMARVTITGTVTRAPSVKQRRGRTDVVSIRLRDRGGYALAVARGDAAARLAGGGRLPARGASVRVTGTARLLAGMPPCVVLDSDRDIDGVGE